MPIGRMIAALGLAALRAQARIALRRIAVRAVTGVIAGLFVLVAVGFLVAALTVWLAGEVGTINALLIVAGLFIVIAGIVFLAGRMQGRRAAPASPAAAGTQRGDAAAEGGGSGPQRPPPGSELGSMAVVAVAGFMLAREMFRRR